jgi:hypothetical protein
MASAWGKSWGNVWGNAWGSITTEPPVPPPPYRPSSGGYARPTPLEVIDFDTQSRIQDDHELVEIVQILAATGVFYGKV